MNKVYSYIKVFITTKILYKRDCSFKVIDVKYDKEKDKYEIALEEVDE